MHGRAYEVAAMLGVKLKERRAFNSFLWNGRDLAALWYEGSYIEPQTILHELCHWIVAAPWQRRLPEWGMSTIKGLGRPAWHEPLLDLGTAEVQERDVRSLYEALITTPETQLRDFLTGLTSVYDFSLQPG